MNAELLAIECELQALMTDRAGMLSYNETAHAHGTGPYAEAEFYKIAEQMRELAAKARRALPTEAKP